MKKATGPIKKNRRAEKVVLMLIVLINYLFVIRMSLFYGL